MKHVTLTILLAFFTIICYGQKVVADKSETLFNKEEQTEVVETVSISPNPTTKYLTISSIQNLTTYEIYDVLGKKILSKDIIKEINVSNLKDGVYFLKLKGPNQTFNKKFIKQ
jgi:hypothetical protein|tara:strand:+ start:208 stop:546 length:339 start_codon:yes stop_codon:yes gene_type:complete